MLPCSVQLGKLISTANYVSADLHYILEGDCMRYCPLGGLNLSLISWVFFFCCSVTIDLT